MSLFEEKIRSNLEFFDSEEPIEGHLERFREKLESQENVPGFSAKTKRFRIIAIAAVFLILLSTGTFIYFFPPAQMLKQAESQVAKISLPIEVELMMDYYNQLTEKQIDTLNTLAPDNKEAKIINEIARNEVNSLDLIIDSLKVEYNKNKNNDQIYSALVFTQQKKAEILETIITKVNDGNNWKKDQTESKF